MQSKIKFHSAILEVHGGHLQITMVKIVNLSFAIIFCFQSLLVKQKTKNTQQTNNQKKKKKQKEKSDLKKVNQPIH